MEEKHKRVFVIDFPENHQALAHILRIDEEKQCFEQHDLTWPISTQV
jgi:hypothetical protein